MQHDEHHPRPQLTRPQWTDLGGPWQFAYDDHDRGRYEGWHRRPDVFNRTITVPFPPESSASGISDGAYHSVVWYRRTCAITTPTSDRRVLLHFGAVDYWAQVWVNGHFVAQHEGGHTPFTADITDAMHADAEQVVVVRAEDQPQDLTQPRGKQDWEVGPHRIWYPRTTGIWQPVWLEVVPSLYIANLRWTPDLQRGMLGMQVTLNRSPEQTLRLHVRLTLNGDTLAHDTYEFERSELRRELSLDAGGITMRRDRLLWSPMFPNLVDVELTLLNGDERIDAVNSYVGLRSVGVANGRFLLNSRPYYLRLVLEQGYWPQSHLAAPSADALRQEVELIKALGFNGVRIHQKVEDPRFLYWCDRLGLLVWGEMANAYVFGPRAIERLTREWIDVLHRDYNHPCIVTWVPFNESWGVPNLEDDPAQRAYVHALYQLTKALDPTRPVIGNDGWEHLASDICGVHDYALDGATIRERYSTLAAVEHTLHTIQPYYRSLVLPDYHRQNEPIMLTECGGISYKPDTGQPWFGYGTVTTAEEFVAKYDEVIGAILECAPITGFCYTQLTDTEQETNGLLHADRTPKLDMEAVRAITARPSKAMPGEVLLDIHTVAAVTPFHGGGST